MNEKNSETSTISNYGILFRNSFYSFLKTYGTFIFSLLSTILLARIINDVNWSYFIIALSYIQIISIILNFLPPSIRETISYFIPRYLSLQKKNELKRFILRSLLVKTIFVIIIFLISFLIFTYFSEIFAINLPVNILGILVLLSPLIIINNIQTILNGINMGFNKFKWAFLVVIIQYSIYIGLLLFYFVAFKSIELDTFCIIYVLAALIPFLLNIIFVIFQIYKIKTDDPSTQTFKHDVKEMVKYGGQVRTATFFKDIWGEIQVLSIGVFEPQMVMGFKISRDLLSVSTNTAIASSYPLTVSFSSFIAKDEKDNIVAIYNLLIKYLIFLITLITGILFFCTDLFIILIYGETRIIYSGIVKLYLFTFIFLILTSPFDSLLLAEYKTKLLIYIKIIGLLIRVPLYLFLLINFDLIHAIVGIIISNSIFSALYLIITIKIGKIKLDLNKILFQYIAFFLSLIITVILEFFILDLINEALFGGLLYAQNFNVFRLLTFLLVFMFLIIKFKLLTTSDINYLQSFFISEKKMHKATYMTLNFLKKLLKD